MESNHQCFGSVKKFQSFEVLFEGREGSSVVWKSFIELHIAIFDQQNMIFSTANILFFLNQKPGSGSGLNEYGSEILLLLRILYCNIIPKTKNLQKIHQGKEKK